MNVGKRSRLVVASFAAATCALAAAAACSNVTDAHSPLAEAAADVSAADPRRAVPDADEVSCEAGDASGAVPPAPFAGRRNPVGATTSAIAAGRDTFKVRCVFCHGTEGKGDGPEGPKNPPPANLTARRRDDDFLLWRISAGGRTPPFCSAMPAFERILSEAERWQLVAFVRTLEPAADDAGSDAD